MRSLALLSLSIGAAHAAALAARDTVISTSKRDPTYNQKLGQPGTLTTVSSGVTYWLSGGSTHNIYGNLDNSGSLIISQTDYLKTNPYAGGQTCDFVGHDANNGNLINRAGGAISINDFGSASAPTYDWYLRTMENSGSIQFCGRGDTGGSTYQLYCDQDCHNYGVIDFEQYNDNLGASFVWRNAAIGSNAGVNIYNEGAFRLVNVVFHNVQNVLGSGCWVIDSGSVLYLEDGSGAFQNPNAGPTFPSQQIFFTSAGDGSNDRQTLHMDTAVYSRNSNFGPQVYNFGSAHAIEFYETIKSSGGFSYASGVLTVTFNSNNRVNIKIGTGYDASAFYVTRNPQHYNTAGYNAIFYRGSTPAQTVPGTCLVSLAKCANPESTAGVPSGSTTTSSVSFTRSSSVLSSTTVSTTTAVVTSSSLSTTSAIPTTSTTVSTTAVSTTAASTTAASTTAVSTTAISTTQSTPRVSSSSTTTASTTQVTTSAAPTTTSSAASTTTITSKPTTSAVSTTTTSASTTVSTGTGPCANGAPPSSTYVASNGDVYGVCLNTDFSGGDLSNAPGITSAGGCAEACSRTAGCIAGSLARDSQYCYLKSTLTAASPNNGVDSVYKISSGSGPSTSTTVSTTSAAPTTSVVVTSSSTKASTTAVSTTAVSTTAVSTTATTTSATGAAGPCAGGAGPSSTYVASNGDVYGVCLNTDFGGGDLTSVGGISNTDQCAEACSQQAGCVAGSLLRGASTCYLKSTQNPGNANSGVDSVYKISSGSGSTTVSSATTTTTTRVSSTTTPLTTSPSSSVATTATTTPRTTPVSTTTSAAATTTTGAPGSGPCAGGAGPDRTYTASNGDVYGVCLNTDFSGGDLTNVSGVPDANSCADACSRTANCVAGSVVTGGQVCYLKSTQNPGNANSGVDSVYKISSGPSSSRTTTTAASTTRASSTTSPAITTTSACACAPPPQTVTQTVTVTATG